MGLIDRIEDEWRECQRCPLHALARNVVVGTGPVPCDIIVIGEAPGEDEDERGTPFIGKSGQLLRAVAREADLDMSMDAYITNVCACRPPQNRTPNDVEIAACSPRMIALLQAVQPKVALLVGMTPLKAMTGATSGITRVRGWDFKVSWTWKGQRHEITAIPTYHPAYLLRMQDPKRKEEFKKDIARVVEIAKSG